MVRTLIKHEILPISEWGPEKYGVKLVINPTYFIEGINGISLDVEDDEKGNFVGLGIYHPENKTCYYWTKLILFDLPNFVAHNGRSDISKLQKWGFKVNIENLIWDTQIFAHVIDSSRRKYGLKHLAAEDLGIVYPSYEELVGKKSSKIHTTLDKLPIELVANYNAMDCLTTYKLYELQRNRILQ